MLCELNHEHRLNSLQIKTDTQFKTFEDLRALIAFKMKKRTTHNCLDYINSCRIEVRRLGSFITGVVGRDLSRESERVAAWGGGKGTCKDLSYANCRRAVLPSGYIILSHIKRRFD